MKKLLATLSAVLCCFCMMTAQGVDLSSFGNEKSPWGQLNYYTAFNVTLNNDKWLSGTEGLSGVVALNNINLSYHTNSEFSRPWLSIAVFEVTGGNEGTFVGKATNSYTNFNSPVSEGVSSLAFDFGGLNLESSTTYMFFFIKDETYFNGLKLGDQSPGTSSWGPNSVVTGVPLETWSHDDYYSTDVMYSSSGDHVREKNPVITINATNAVPEPSSAALSLLGLASICFMRKRRR